MANSYLKEEPRFEAFSDVAISRKSFITSTLPGVINCRRKMEFAVKRMYSVDDLL